MKTKLISIRETYQATMQPFSKRRLAINDVSFKIHGTYTELMKESINFVLEKCGIKSDCFIFNSKKYNIIFNRQENTVESIIDISGKKPKQVLFSTDFSINHNLKLTMGAGALLLVTIGVFLYSASLYKKSSLFCYLGALTSYLIGLHSVGFSVIREDNKGSIASSTQMLSTDRQD